MRTHDRILQCAAAGFVLGIFYSSFAHSDIVAVTVIVSASISLILAIVFSTYAKYFSLLAIFLAAGVAGDVRMIAGVVAPDSTLATYVDQKIVVHGRISQEPDIRDGSVRLTVDVDRLQTHDTTIERAVRVLAVAPAHTEAAYGDEVEVEGTLRLQTSFETGAGRAFNYPQFLATKGITYEVGFAETRVISHGGNPIKRAMIEIKTGYISGLRMVLHEPYAGLASGITAGDKRSVGSELSEQFQRVSLIHILVLSGYNITVVLSACMHLLARVSRGPRLFVVFAIVSFFVVISGGASSAARAGAMAFAAVFAALYGREFLAVRVLLVVAVGMIAWNPYILAFDPGFQLSVLATLGLVTFSSHIERMLRFIPEQFSIREIVAATVATQLTVLPLLLYQNGMLSLVALPANVLALIAVPSAMAAAAVASLAGVALGTWGVIFALPAYILLKYIISIADLFAAVPFAAVMIPAFSPWVLLVLYGAIALWYWHLETASRLNKKEPQ